MLCQFSFKNFRSYKDETVLDLQAVASSKDESRNFKESLLQTSDGKAFLPVSVIYGPNAGGKSNVIKALSYATNIVTSPITILKETNNLIPMISCEPFKFDESSKNEPTEFTFFFRPDEFYEYKYFISIKDEKIIEEYLYRKNIKPNSRTSIVFERTQDNIKLGSCISKAKINSQINNSIPLLSFLAINYEIEPISIVVEWLQQVTICDFFYKPLMIAMLDIFYEDKQVVRLMNDVGIDISDYKVQRDSADISKWGISVEHTINNKKYQLNLNEESEGTQKLFELFPWVLYAMRRGNVLIVDELDAKLHPKLLKYIIMLFKNPEINTNNAQLIFTSHDISTMKSSVFRTDEIWFACKREDESSDLYSLYDIKDENGNHIQPSASFDKQYLEGRYGADPYFCNMMNWK